MLDVGSVGIEEGLAELLVIVHHQAAQVVELLLGSRLDHLIEQRAIYPGEAIGGVAHPQMRLTDLSGRPMAHVVGAQKSKMAGIGGCELPHRSVESRDIGGDTEQPLPWIGGRDADYKATAAVVESVHRERARARRAEFGLERYGEIRIGMFGRFGGWHFEDKIAGRISRRRRACWGLLRGYREDARKKRRQYLEPNHTFSLSPPPPRDGPRAAPRNDSSHCTAGSGYTDDWHRHP